MPRLPVIPSPSPSDFLDNPSHAGVETDAQRVVIERNRTRVADVRDYGAVGDGVADDTDAIQTALDENVNGVVFLPPGEFLVSRSIQYGSRTHLVGSGSGHSTHSGSRLIAAEGFDGDYVVDCAAFDGGGAADWWHKSTLANLVVHAKNDVYARQIGGVRIHRMGETSLLSRVSVFRATRGFDLTGVQAVGTIFACDAWFCTDYGLYFGAHPDFPGGISESSGSIRVLGFSGDANAPGLIRLSGALQAELLGIKHEGWVEGNLGCIVYEGHPENIGGARANFTVSGRFAMTPDSEGERNIIRIAGGGFGGHPAFVLLPSTGVVPAGKTSNIIRDDTNGQALPGSQPRVLTIWARGNSPQIICPDGPDGSSVGDPGNSMLAAPRDVSVLWHERGLILRSPNGNFHRVRANNDGSLFTETP